MRNLVKAFSIFAITAISVQTTQAQTINDIFNALKNANSNNGNNNTGNTSSTNNTGNTGSNGFSLNNLSNTDIVNGLRQALEVGAKNAGSKLSLQNGFFGNTLIKILMPPEVKNAESIMRQFGLGQLVDQTILSMNRAAEDAAGKAVPIFVNAITSITIQDGLNILTGGAGAATNYLKMKTTGALTNAFRPVIQTSLNKLNVGSYWNQLFTNYNKIPIVRNKINPDLTAYVTERALNGLFVTIAQEENNIRTNPSARVTDLLKKVFGAR